MKVENGDWTAFKGELKATAALVRRRIDDEVAARYFRALEDLEWSSLLAALRKYARTVEPGQAFLTPVELRRRATMRVASRPVEARPAAQPPGRNLTRAEAAVILRDVATRAAPRLAATFREAAAAIDRTPADAVAGDLVAAVADALEAPPEDREAPPEWWDR
jgi:hypothetical protein